MRGHHRDTGPQLTNPLRDLGLVIRIRVSVQEADRDRRHTLRPEVRDDGRQLLQAQRRHDPAGIVDPLADLLAQIARDERARLRIAKIEECGAIAPSYRENVAKPPRRYEAGDDALSLGQGIDDDGRPVREKLDLRGRNAGLVERPYDPVLEIGRRRVGLRRLDGEALAAGFVALDGDVHQVREGSADVARDTHQGPPPQVVPVAARPPSLAGAATALARGRGRGAAPALDRTGAGAIMDRAFAMRYGVRDGGARGAAPVPSPPRSRVSCRVEAAWQTVTPAFPPTD